MTDRPIIFSAPMIRALLDGRKTQTRRLAWRDPIVAHDSATATALSAAGHLIVDGPDETLAFPPSPWQRVRPGHQLWVRETWQWGCQPGAVLYAADNIAAASAWRRSIHLPRWASRLTLTVTGVRMQRLQEISEEDALAEGAKPIELDHDDGCGNGWTEYWFLGGFIKLWKRIHGSGAWNANPEVVALTFTVERRNIDA